MANPYLVASLAKLRDEFNNLAPKRDKASDGWIGDTAHSARASDHNPDEKGAVHAIDVDVDLKVPGLSMEKVVQFLLARCRSGQETRLKYMIFNRRIWAKSAGWRQQDYLGQNPHDHHAHFSGVYTEAAERSVKSWELDNIDPPEEPMTTPAQNWAQDVDPSAGTYSASGALWTTLLRTGQIGPLAEQVNSLNAKVEDQEDDLDALAASLIVINAKLDLILAKLNEPAAKN